MRRLRDGSRESQLLQRDHNWIIYSSRTTAYYFIELPREIRDSYPNSSNSIKKLQANNWIKKKALSFLAAIQAKRPKIAFFSYLEFQVRSGMISIWGYLLLWENLEWWNSKVSKIECRSICRTGKQNSSPRKERRFYWKQWYKQYQRTLWAYSYYLWSCVRISTWWCKNSSGDKENDSKIH